MLDPKPQIELVTMDKGDAHQTPMVVHELLLLSRIYLSHAYACTAYDFSLSDLDPETDMNADTSHVAMSICTCQYCILYERLQLRRFSVLEAETIQSYARTISREEGE